MPGDYPWKVLGALNRAIGSHINDKDSAELREVISQKDISRYLSLSAHWGLQSINSGEESELRGDPAVRIMLASVVKKYQFDGDSDARKAAAIQTILTGEKTCSKFNRYGRKVLERAPDDPVLVHAKHFVDRVLGSLLPNAGALTATSRHGPGASTGTESGQTSAFDKNVGWPYEVTARCLPHARMMIETDDRWRGALEASYRRKKRIPAWEILNQDLFWQEIFTVVDGNRITTVPKNALTERSIAIEPEMNMLLQLGVDGFVRKRLKAWGIDLDDQSKNQKLAYEGSLRCDFLAPATIDLASASDTISLGIAKLLLPTAWYGYMCDIRSPKGTLPDGTSLRFSKLSSMGNGDTFAMESLIFASLLFGVCKVVLGYYPREMVSIFGDDIICPEGCASILVRYLGLSGFQLNLDKSFLQGDVKESCGTDWYRGSSVRAVFLEDRPSVVSELFSDRNRLVRWLHLHGYATSDALACIDSLYTKWIPLPFRGIVGPYSDTEFDTYWHDACASFRRRTTGIHYGCYVHRALSSKYRLRQDDRLLSPSEKRGYDNPESLQAALEKDGRSDGFDFLKLSARLAGGSAEPYDPSRDYTFSGLLEYTDLPHWMKPLQKQIASGSVFGVYDTNSIRRDVTQRVRPEKLPTSYLSAVELLFTGGTIVFKTNKKA